MKLNAFLVKNKKYSLKKVFLSFLSNVQTKVNFLKSYNQVFKLKIQKTLHESFDHKSIFMDWVMCINLEAF